jgi:hypothetical protein
MLKTVSSITNAIGALNYKGTWNASTNSPALASGVGTKGDYYVVSVAGSTNLDGETLWGVGDWAVFNGSVWQKVEGGNTINATTVSASTSVTTPVIQATSSAGGTLKNNGGTAQLQWGSGGGSNLSLEVATNINPANAAVAISPTGTGTVTINPATASTMNNVAIGGTIPLAITGTTITSTGSITTPILLGTQYALTSFSGTTAIVDTGIVAVVETASTAQIYLIDIKVNLSPGGPGGRRAVASYLVGVGVGTSVDISQTLLHRTSQSGIGDVTMASTFWDGSTEATSFSSGGPWQIRLKLDTIYANPSASLQCRITQITP